MSLLNPGEPEQAALAIERAHDPLQRPAAARRHEFVQARIDVAAARAHHESLERRKPHGRIHAAPALTAQALQPLPRCAVIKPSDSSGRPSRRAASPATKRWLVP